MTATQLQPFTFEELDGGARVSVATSTAVRAEEIVAAARTEAAAIVEAARGQGYDEGYASGQAAALAELQPTRETLAAIGRELVAEHDALFEQMSKDAVELALALAEKVVGAALEVKPELVLDVVTAALRRVSDRTSVVLEINPEDYELVRGAIDEIAAGFGGFASLDVVPERRVGRGGCTVRMAEGEIGACIDEQLARAAELVRETLRG
jgi:flagellar assembly protein FliH